MICGSLLSSAIALAVVFASQASAAVIDGHAVAGARAFDAALAPRATTALDAFCTDYKTACNEVCLQGKTGMTKIVVACGQNDDGSFGFGCTCDGASNTANALKRVTKPLPVTQSLTSTAQVTQTKFKTAVTSIKGGTATLLSTSILTVGAPASTKTVWDATVTVGVLTTTTSTPATYTYTQEPYTYVTTTPASSTQTSLTARYTSTYSTLQYNARRRDALGEALEVSVHNVKRATTFCNTFFTACDDTCDSENSSTKTSTCDKTTSTVKKDTYTLLCKCKNNKVRTTQALSGVVDEDKIDRSTTVTTTQTSLVTSTAFSTSLQPATTTTSLVVKTSTKGTPALATATLHATRTIASSTRIFTRNSWTFTTEIVSTTTNTYTQEAETPITTLATSTTYNVLAPTGVLRFDSSDASEGSRYGTVNGVMTFTRDVSQATKWGLTLQSDEGATPAVYYLMDVGSGFDGSFLSAPFHKGPYDYDGGCTGSSVCDFQPSDYFYPSTFLVGPPQQNTANPSAVYEVPLTFTDVVFDNVTWTPFATDYPNDAGAAAVQIGDTCAEAPLGTFFEPLP